MPFGISFFGTQKEPSLSCTLTIFAGACTTALIPRVLAIYINNET